MKTKVRVMSGLLAILVLALGIGVAALVFRWKTKAPEVVAGPVQSCSNGQIARLLLKPPKTDQYPPPPRTMFLEVTSPQGEVTVTEFPTEINFGDALDLQWSGIPETLILRSDSKLFRFMPESRTFTELVMQIPNAKVGSWATAQDGATVGVAAIEKPIYESFLSMGDFDSIKLFHWNLSSGSVDTSVTIPFANGVNFANGVDMASLFARNSSSISPDARHIVYQKRMPLEGKENSVASLDLTSTQTIDDEFNPEEFVKFLNGGRVEIADVLTGQPVYSKDTTGILVGAWWSPDGTRCLLKNQGEGTKIKDELLLIDLANMNLESIADRIEPELDGTETAGRIEGADWVGGERFIVVTLYKFYSSRDGSAGEKRAERISVVVDTETWDIAQLPIIGEYVDATPARSRPFVVLTTGKFYKDDPKMCIVRIGPDKNDSGSSVTQVPLKAGENPSWLWSCGDTKLLLLEGGKVREVPVP